MRELVIFYISCITFEPAIVQVHGKYLLFRDKNKHTQTPPWKRSPTSNYNTRYPDYLDKVNTCNIKETKTPSPNIGCGEGGRRRLNVIEVWNYHIWHGAGWGWKLISTNTLIDVNVLALWPQAEKPRHVYTGVTKLGSVRARSIQFTIESKMPSLNNQRQRTIVSGFEHFKTKENV